MEIDVERKTPPRARLEEKDIKLKAYKFIH